MRVIPTKTNAENPTGKPFIIERCPFQFGKQIDPLEVVQLDEDKVLNWPMVYILANDASAYVGQTTSVATRITQHEANEEKRDFTTVNIIFNEEFNASVITDYEHRLIGYMQGDGRYKLTNKNSGMNNTNYFSKAQYSEMFEDLWEQLRALDLVEHTIDEIEESEVFKYSPYKGLTVDQRVALDKIMDAIKNGLDKAEPIVIEGMPGTGKTVLAVYLLKMLKDDPDYVDMNIRIIEPVTSLRETLQRSLKGISDLSKNDIIAPSDLAKEKLGYIPNKKKCFDIVLIDEAHKLKQRTNLGTQFGNYDKVNEKLGLRHEATQIDWVLDQVKLPIFFYDPLQSIGPSCVDAERIQNSLKAAIKNPIRLDSQMRVKGGTGYLKYIKSILDGNNPERRSFDGYELVLHDDFSDFVSSFETTYDKHDLTRMIAGYAWKWVSKNDKSPDTYDITFDNIGLRWNCTYENWVGKGLDNGAIAHEVGCIHSIQGYDLSYAYVIIGEDLELDKNTGQLVANGKNYYDRNGKATASAEELTQYIKNIYYVLLTRGIYGTHLYVANPELRKCLSRFFPVQSSNHSGSSSA